MGAPVATPGKVFCFEFVNNYCALFYVAFMKNAVGDECEHDDCLRELSMALGVIFVTQVQPRPQPYSQP